MSTGTGSPPNLAQALDTSNPFWQLGHIRVRRLLELTRATLGQVTACFGAAAQHKGFCAVCSWHTATIFIQY